MITLIKHLGSSGDDSGSIDIGASAVHLAQALHHSAGTESQCGVLLQDMLFQIDNVLKFDVARAVALIISMEEAREALLLAVSKMRVRSTRPGPDDGRRRLQSEEYARTQHVLCELYFFMHNLPHLQPFTRVQVSCRSSGPVRPIDRFADHLPRAQNRQQCYALNSLQCCVSLGFRLGVEPLF